MLTTKNNEICIQLMQPNSRKKSIFTLMLFLVRIYSIQSSIFIRIRYFLLLRIRNEVLMLLFYTETFLINCHCTLHLATFKCRIIYRYNLLSKRVSLSITALTKHGCWSKYGPTMVNKLCVTRYTRKYKKIVPLNYMSNNLSYATMQFEIHVSRRRGHYSRTN